MSRKNQWRPLGAFQVQRVSGRYSCGELDGRDILWIRGPKGANGRRVAWAETGYDNRHGAAHLGLGVYLPANSRGDAIAIGKALLRYVKGS